VDERNVQNVMDMRAERVCFPHCVSLMFLPQMKRGQNLSSRIEAVLRDENMKSGRDSVTEEIPNPDVSHAVEETKF
jgi:hypothetical protein